MSDPLLATKVSLPILRHILVPRKKVLGQLSEGVQDGHLLTLVSAPAGYGKTTTLRMWAAEAGHPVAWVTLERSDNDFKQFLTYILTALGQTVEGLGQASLEMVQNARELDPQRILALLVNELCELDQLITLVLEEYHLIENEAIDQALEFLLNQSIPTLHLVIATREDPNLPLTRLRGRNQLTEIRAADLSFSLEETGDFFANVMGVGLSERDLEILKNRTEGWVAGLQLAALSLKDSTDRSRFVEAFRGTHRHVLDYLIEEVLNSQPEEIRDFLRCTSILDQLSVSLCEAVTGQSSSRKYLHHLESSNLFLVSLDQDRTWYRYHALFAELLKNQLLQTEPARVDDLHERAADWYEQNGFIQKAVEHAFQVPDGEKAARLIAKHGLPFLYKGEVSTVADWSQRLPEALMRASPMICISRAWSLVLMQRRETRREELQQALQAAADSLDRANADDGLRNLITGHIASIQAFGMGSPGQTREKPEKLLEVSQRAQQLLPAGERAIRSVNAMGIGNAYTVLGDIPAAEKAFNQTYEDGVAGGNYYAAVYGPINLILIAMTRGQLSESLQMCETNIDRFNRLSAGQSFPPIGALYILKGDLLLELNQLAEAEQALTHGLSLVHWTGEYRAHFKGYAALARLRAIQGDREGMAASLRSLEETRPEGALYARVLNHRLPAPEWAAHPSDLEAARLWAAQSAIQFDALPDIAGVDPMSETGFRTYQSAAHTLLRLAAQYPGAYPLREAHDYLARQEMFAEAHGLFGWLIEIWIARALIRHVEGKAAEAQGLIQQALAAAEPRGYFRLFIDESDLMRPLLRSVEPRLKDAAFARRLLEAMPWDPEKGSPRTVEEDILSERELEVLRLLAAGQSYKEIGQQLFLSLNTVQFHIKSIYRRLSVNKRVQAIEKAREMGLM